MPKVKITEEQRAAIALEVHRELPGLETELAYAEAKGDTENAASIAEQIAIRKQHLKDLEAAAIADAKTALEAREAENTEDEAENTGNDDAPDAPAGDDTQDDAGRT